MSPESSRFRPGEYANLTGRPTGPVLRVLGRLLPGVAAVQRQVLPYARAWHLANTDALARGGRRWVVLGDSMSLGIGASGPFHGWVGQATTALRADGLDFDVVNLAANGAGVADLLQQQLPVWRALPEQEADVLTVLAGSNDLFGRRGRRAQLPGLFDALAAALPEGAIVALLTQPTAVAREVNARLLTASDRLRLMDLRANGPASWRGKLAADHFHPNDAGYATIAAGFLPALRDGLGSGS